MIIKKEIFISKNPKCIFQLLTTSDEILNYYPLNSIESNWKKGSEIILKGGEDEHEFTDYGIIDNLIENMEIQYSYWSDNHGTKRIPENYLTICYKLTEEEHGTKLILEHSNFKSLEMYRQMEEVWNFLLSNLKEYAESKA